MLELAGSAFVFTFKEGLLARLAHDLRLSVQDFEVVLEGSALRARFGAGSLRVDGVAHGERVDPEGLSTHDKQTIEQTIQREILQVHEHPDVSCQGHIEAGGTSLTLVGQLQLRGVSEPLRVPLQAQDDQLRAELTLVPSHFGITPYKALAGAIRLQDRVVVRLVLRCAGASASELLHAAQPVRWSCH